MTRPVAVGLATAGMLLLAVAAQAQSPPGGISDLTRQLADPQPGEMVGILRLLLGLAVLSVAPALLMMMTAFTRIIIVLSFLRGAMGTQTIPPNSVLAGLALFMTLYVMSPVFEQIQSQALRPYSEGQIAVEEALERGAQPLQEFMLRQTRDRDLLLFLQLSGMQPRPAPQELPFRIVAPAFLISELKTAFEIGLILYLPFLVIDLVVASTLMSMGMMMVPPVMVSLPLKLMLFVLVDGWALLTQSVVLSFI